MASFGHFHHILPPQSFDHLSSVQGVSNHGHYLSLFLCSFCGSTRVVLGRHKLLNFNLTVTNRNRYLPPVFLIGTTSQTRNCRHRVPVVRWIPKLSRLTGTTGSQLLCRSETDLPLLCHSLTPGPGCSG